MRDVKIGFSSGFKGIRRGIQRVRFMIAVTKKLKENAGNQNGVCERTAFSVLSESPVERKHDKSSLVEDSVGLF